MKLAAGVLLFVVVYAVALGWSTGVWAAVAASIAAVLAALRIWPVIDTSSGHLTYTGERNSDGLPHGRGTMTYPDGYKYTGEFKDGRRHGQGTEA